MGIPSAIGERYGQAEPQLNGLHGYLKPTLAKFCKDGNYQFDEGRVKSLESVAEKLESGRFATWSSLDDLVAFTIVVPTTGHEKPVLEFLDQSFDRSALRSRGTTRKPPDVFRFDATRWYGTLRDEDPPPQVVEGASTVTFEVQIKTAFEHAWSVVTHDIVYKGDDVDWNKLRLAAQLKAMTEQIDLMVEHFEEVASRVAASGYPETDSMTKALDVLKSLLDDGHLDQTLTPQSWTRLAENLLALVRDAGPDRRSGKWLSRLVGDFDTAVRNGDFRPAVSGSLHQAIIGYAGSAADYLDLSRFPIVQSTELKTFYGLTPPTPVLLDQ